MNNQNPFSISRVVFQGIKAIDFCCPLKQLIPDEIFIRFIAVVVFTKTPQSALFAVGFKILYVHFQTRKDQQIVVQRTLLNCIDSTISQLLQNVLHFPTASQMSRCVLQWMNSVSTILRGFPSLFDRRTNNLSQSMYRDALYPRRML